MAVSMWERPLSRPFDLTSTSQSLTLQFFGAGTEDQDALYAYVTANTPATSGTLVRKRIKADRAGPQEWFIDVEYGTLDADRAVGSDPVDPTAPGATDALPNAYTIDTTAQTVHVTQAIATRYRRIAADGAGAGVGTGPDEKLAIGVTRERVEGVDIFAPNLQFTRTVRRATVTLAYMNSALYGLVGRVNNAGFYGFAAGELLYMGCTGTYTNNGYWELTHKFAASPNETAIDVGGGITVPDKKGWEYLWVGYDPDTVVNKVLMVPKVAYVQQVYKTGNFALLQIGA